jgi:hypothetical protein
VTFLSLTPDSDFRVPDDHHQGGDVNTKGEFGQTPLYQAATNGNVAMTKLFLDKGADPNVMAVGMTPLLGAIWRGHTEVVRLLVERGANVNLASNWMSLMAPIHYCGAYGNAEIARILVAAGADVTARDKRGKTAADFAKEYKKDEVLAVLVKAGVPQSYSGNAAKDIVSISKIAVEGERSTQLRNRFIIPTRQHQGAPEVCIDDKRKGVKLDRPFSLFNRLVKSAKRRQQSVPVPMMSGCIVGIELDRALKLGFRLRQFEIIAKQHCEPRMSFWRTRVQLDGFPYRSFRFWKHIL